jgi:hypothetical protein
VGVPELIAALARSETRLVLGTEAVYELARTFQSEKQDARDRGRRLFSYLGNFIELRIPKEVDKLSQGIFDLKADHSLKQRKREAEDTRSAMAIHYKAPHMAKLRGKMADVPQDGVKKWIARELPRTGRSLLRGHLADVFHDASRRQLTLIAKKLLASSRYRVANAMTRCDLYLNWRFSQTGSMPRDIPSDTYHVVNASYCDVYATCEDGQAKYVPLVLNKTRFALYREDIGLSSWLTTLRRILDGAFVRN